jgi:hypothetical protein
MSKRSDDNEEEYELLESSLLELSQNMGSRQEPSI